MTTKQDHVTKRVTFEVELPEHRLIKSMAAVQGVAIREYMLGLVHNDLKKHAENNENQNLMAALKEVSGIKKGEIKKQSMQDFLSEL